MKKKLLMLALLIWTTHIVAQKQVHIKDCFDFDWKFTLSDNPEYAKPDYADASWEDIQLPHDWNIKQEFDIKAGGSGSLSSGRDRLVPQNIQSPFFLSGTPRIHPLRWYIPAK